MFTTLWSAAVDANFAVVVVPGIAEDVAATMKYADRYNVPFLAVNRAHGTASALSNVYNGIEIYIHALNSIEIAENGESALMGGGTYQDQVVNYLAAYGKVTSTGACGCVGMMGPGLGGGFGRFQGYFGLVLDNIIDMNVVLADGSMVTVSESSKSDLYWGMRGAGHNFGIVTSFNYKIYDQPVVTWFVETMIFTGDKLEKFFELLNILGANGTQPVGLTTYTVFAMSPEVSPTEPVIVLLLEYAGTESEAEPLYAPFLSLGPVVATNVTVPYTGVAHASGSGVEDFVCQNSDLSWKLYPVGALVYNITTNRQIYSLFSKMINDNPEFNNSVVQFEGYSLQGMKAVDPASTAYAHRADNLLLSYALVYPPKKSLDAIANKYGYHARSILHAGEPGRPLNTYVNYASSDETLEELYGYEPWRLARLRALKQKYDPQGKFDFYAPINP
ncbi:hypothetical protein JMJ35_009849 [Cladonia borealis]|uniref:FAD-binding PCMH-type domain-containing protein n=1 Tax=Cladonia borealis TaxID=184061 RepID=A0AA39V6F2_9LECA|nr:hypothetical protein JMJ35_009849 [Cladonia borealis]